MEKNDRESSVMIYDGNCGFCKYWIAKWKKITKDQVTYRPYQDALLDYPEISEQSFKNAVHLHQQGKWYVGAHAPYKTYYDQGKYRFLLQWYERKRGFKKLSDFAYQWIADHRNLMFKLSKTLFGTDPNNPQHYWLFYLLIFIAGFSLAVAL